GSGGSNRIRSALLQVISNLVDFRMQAKAAVAAPRLHVEGDQLRMEAGFPPEAMRKMARDFPDHRVFDEPHMFFGGVHLAQVTRHGKLSAVGDARRDGAGVAV
ncbi:MAG: gamma-glutamyltransferase, partial [Gammaproteobacteria bacterium]|nr:gamma-glutamyltransferase [Gammaproteobacteria bacterium]MDD9874136.1 gamma-glutamyltransferase [Gammaproteobacteria bacterium]